MEQDHRVSRAVDVTIQSSHGHWAGKTIDLSPYGAKVTSAAKSVSLPLGTIVQLRVALPDGNPPLSLSARVVETSSDGVGLSFFNLRNQQAQRLKDLLDSLPQECQELPQQFDSDRSLASEQAVSPQSSLPPEFVEDTRPAERGVTPNVPADEKPEAAESDPLSDVRSEQARLQDLLSQVGLNSLCVPSNGTLSAQWRNFLEQLGPNASGSSTGRWNRSRRDRGL